MCRLAIALIGSVLLVSCASQPQSSSSSAVSGAVQSDLAPTGKLRAGINFGNVLLAAREADGSNPRGVAVDLVQELGRRLNVPVEMVGYDAAGPLAAAVKDGAWDVGFLAIDPDRANDITFSAGYLEVDSTYLVPAGSPLHTIEDVDREGVRVAITAKSAYDLFLTRSLQRAQLVRAPNTDESYELFVKEKLDALAGLKPRLVMDAEKLPGSRVLDGRFTAVQQAAGTPKGREAGARYLREYIEEVKASGFVAKSIEKHGVRGVSVAPSAPVE
jgi:polar amino acid transport system substrate-binding protein